MITGAKIFSSEENIEHFKSKLPITADIFLTAYCNNKCKYCTYGRWELEHGEKRYMSYDLFVKVAKRLKELGTRGFILTGGGEPTINPDFSRIVEYLESEGIPYGINTNFNVYREFSPNYLKVSLDSSNADDYKAIRGVDKYADVMKNIAEYARNKHEVTKLGLQCVVSHEGQATKFYAEHKGLDVDYIVFRPIESTGGRYYKDHAQELERIKQELDVLSRADGRIVVNYKWHETGARFSKCYGQWAQIAVDEKGQVIYCCHKPYEVVGSIFDKNIMKKKSAYKTDMSMCDVPCRMTGSNKQLEMMEYEQESCFI